MDRARRQALRFGTEMLSARTVTELRTAVEPALRLGGVHRYGSWLRLLVYADDDSMRAYAPAALHYLRTLTDPVLTT